MDFNDTPEEAAFRAEVRQWLEANARPRGGAPEAQDFESVMGRAKAFQARKAERGFAAITWPKEYGGLNGTAIQSLIYGQEQADYSVNNAFFGIGLGMCIPMVIQYGSDEHRARYVKTALRGDEIWCQLFSEPAGGSDVAAARTMAVRDGDAWVVSGQKVWSTGAHYCDYGIVLARTDRSVPKHKGLTMFIVNMKAPGVEVRPIKQLSGAADFNEVFFTDVRIPDSDRLGAPGDGWKVAISTLMHERSGSGRGFGYTGWRDHVELARRQTLGGRPMIEDGRVRERIADGWITEFGTRLLNFRAQTALSKGQTPGPEQSILKLLATHRSQEAAYLAMDLLAESGALQHDELGDAWRRVEHTWTWGAAQRIAGGSDEILKNIVAERVLGLPQDVRVDKDVPFRDLVG